MALFKKETETKNENVSKNTREVDELSEMFLLQPVEIEDNQEAQEVDEVKPMLSLMQGSYKKVNLSDLVATKSVVQTEELIVKENNGKYEIIGMAPVEVKVIEANKEETSLLLLDYVDKTVGLEEKKKLNLYKYELQNSEMVQKLVGKTPAAVNGFTDAEFANMVLKSDIDANLKVLPSDALLEASKLPADVQKILGNIITKVGTKNITAEAIKSLQGVPASESAILLKLLQA